ncbi:hypothetical protein CesoFtcFv8_000660 [Champsocephalus esox]|uniref:Uncharacterized protein n=2 Tax=Champsocephalus TaxID=52236 RepID=A0AAN8EM90_CHAGU|nr:hypothetical protein CesoFtcFv8_000660 [Champsocephalus esox]KAK5934993.1 hypothetical protein CgunFtcFv8_020395 [Champsocephalus gunnari]
MGVAPKWKSMRKHLCLALKLSVTIKLGLGIEYGLWLKFLASIAKQRDGGPLQLHCLHGDEAKGDQTLGIRDEDRQIVEVVISVMTTLNCDHRLSLCCPSPTSITFIQRHDRSVI